MDTLDTANGADDTLHLFAIGDAYDQQDLGVLSRKRLGLDVLDITVTGPAPFCGDNIKNGAEECDGTDGVTNGFICLPNCTLAPINSSVIVSVAPWFPQELDYVFLCEAGFTPTSYDWYFGDP